MVRSVMIKFWSNDVYIHVETKLTNQNTFPAVTFCLEPISVKNVYCNHSANDDLQGAIPSTEPSCNIGEWWKRLRLKNPVTYLTFLNAVGSTEAITFPHATFSFRCAYKKSCLNRQISSEFFSTVSESHNCMRWNWKGNFYNAKNRIDLSLYISDPVYRYRTVIAYVHHHQESPISYEFTIPLSSQQTTQLILQKTVKKRMQRSPPNHCEETYYNNSKNIFPGRYTVEACMDSYLCIETLKRCGETLDFCREYVPTSLLEKHWRFNQTFKQVYECLYDGYRRGLFDADQKYCVSPCESVKYFTTSLVTPGPSLLSLMFRERNVYELEEDRQIYTWEDFVAGIGGMIGLFCGFSILSMAELFVFIGLKCFSRFCSDKGTNELKTQKMQHINNSYQPEP